MTCKDNYNNKATTKSWSAGWISPLHYTQHINSYPRSRMHWQATWARYCCLMFALYRPINCLACIFIHSLSTLYVAHRVYATVASKTIYFCDAMSSGISYSKAFLREHITIFRKCINRFRVFLAFDIALLHILITTCTVWSICIHFSNTYRYQCSNLWSSIVVCANVRSIFFLCSKFTKTQSAFQMVTLRT